jgi:hypothetical protein
MSFSGEGKRAGDEDQRMIREGAESLARAGGVDSDDERLPDDSTRPPAFRLGLAVIIGLILFFGAVYFLSQR